MQNSVEIIGVYGSDEIIALSAWTSTSRTLTPEKKERIPSLLQKLKDGSDGKSHETPWEKSLLHFIVTTDIASHIHLLKHRISSVNAESARYKELRDDKFYIPDDWPEVWRLELEGHVNQSFHMYHRCIESLVNEHGFDRKRAKESARYFNPYATQLTADVAFNFRSFINFCKLRAAPGAQKEIRDIAVQMIDQLQNYEGRPFEHSIRIWGLDQLADNARL